jgi:hypothetical protein
MFDPGEKVMRPVPKDESTLTPEQRTWTRFQEGEELIVKGIKMRVHEIGESRMVLKFAVLVLLLAVPSFAQQKTAPDSPAAAKPSTPVITDAERASFFKAQSQMIQANAQAQQSQAAFQAQVAELQKACGDKFTLQLNAGGDPECIAKSAPPTTK